MRRGVVTCVTVGSMFACVVLGIAWATTGHHAVPVRLVGRAQVVHHRVSLSRNRIAATRLEAVATGTVIATSLYVRHARHGARLRIGVYTNRRGRPGRLLSAGGVRGLRSGRWNIVSMGRARVRAHHTYWVAILAQRRAVSLAGTARCARSSASHAGRTLPRRWRAVHRRRRGCRISIYAWGARRSRTTVGTTTATTATTSTTTTPTTPVVTRTIQCYASPGACGYPDPAAGNVGVANCAALAPFGPADLPAGSYTSNSGIIDLYGDNVTIRGYDITGWQFDLNGTTGTTFDDDCLSTDVNNGAGVVYETSGASRLTVENSTIAAPGCPVATADSAICSGAGVDATDVGGGSGTVIDNDILTGAIESVNGLGTGSVIENSYIVANGYQSTAHSEDIYTGPGTESLTISHNTLINPFDETAEIFVDNLGAPTCTSSGLTVTDNLLTGGGFVVYSCSGASSLGSSTFAFTDNHIARCRGGVHYDPSTGGEQCGTTRVSGVPGAAFGAGADGAGLWPRGGYFGVEDDVLCAAAGTTWSGNVWDDDGAAIACG